jgi:hypothetical protein
MVINCFSPALILDPSSSMMVSYPSGSVSTNRSTNAALAAAMISSSDALGRLNTVSVPQNAPERRN